MYKIPHYTEQDIDAVIQFMHAHPFAFVCGRDEKQQPVATQVPLLISERDGKILLEGHMMRRTDHHLAFESNSNALVVFTGAHTYVSASWYTNAKQASTWNYMSVHARGNMIFLDEEKLISILERTTTHFEGNDFSKASFKNLDQDYIQKMCRAIIAFEIEVQSIDNVFKLSQNRDKKSYEHIMNELSAGSADAKRIADEMAKRKNKLFGNE